MRIVTEGDHLNRTNVVTSLADNLIRRIKDRLFSTTRLGLKHAIAQLHETTRVAFSAGPVAPSTSSITRRNVRRVECIRQGDDLGVVMCRRPSSLGTCRSWSRRG